MNEQEINSMALDILSGNINLDFNKSNVEGLCDSFCKVYDNARNNEERLKAIEITMQASNTIERDIIFVIESKEFEGKLDEEKVNKKLIELETLKKELIKLRIKTKKRIRKNKVKCLYKKNY